MRGFCRQAIATWALIAGFGVGVARADAGPKFPERGLYLLPGLTFGGSSSLDVGTGFILGGELSLAYWHHGLYGGVVADGLYDWKRESGRMMFGAELGVGPFGVDGGFLLELADGGRRNGLAARLFFHMGIVVAYVRYGGVFDAPDFVEWGLMIKVPLGLWSKWPKRPRRREFWRRPVPPGVHPVGPTRGPTSGPSSGPVSSPVAPIHPPGR